MAIELQLGDALADDFKRRVDGEDSLIERIGEGRLAVNFNSIAVVLNIKESKDDYIQMESKISLLHGDEVVAQGEGDYHCAQLNDTVTFQFNGFAGQIPIVYEEQTA